MRVSKAEMDSSLSIYTLQCAVNSFYRIFLCNFGSRLHIRLVKLDHVGARVEKVFDFFIDGRSIIHCRSFVCLIVIILSLLGHGEWSWERNLDPSVRIRFQKKNVVHLNRCFAMNGTCDSGYWVRMAGAIDCGSRLVDVYAT